MKDLGKNRKPFKDGYEIIKNKTKDIRENVKWFGKTKESAKKVNRFKTSLKKWDKISSIAWSNTNGLERYFKMVWKSKRKCNW